MSLINGREGHCVLQVDCFHCLPETEPQYAVTFAVAPKWTLWQPGDQASAISKGLGISLLPGLCLSNSGVRKAPEKKTQGDQGLIRQSL